MSLNSILLRKTKNVAPNLVANHVADCSKVYCRWPIDIVENRLRKRRKLKINNDEKLRAADVRVFCLPYLCCLLVDCNMRWLELCRPARFDRLAAEVEAEDLSAKNASQS